MELTERLEEFIENTEAALVQAKRDAEAAYLLYLAARLADGDAAAIEFLGLAEESRESAARYMRELLMTKAFREHLAKNEKVIEAEITAFIESAL